MCPISMKGSKTINQRLDIISEVEKVILLVNGRRNIFSLIDDKLKTKLN